MGHKSADHNFIRAAAYGEGDDREREITDYTEEARLNPNEPL